MSRGPGLAARAVLAVVVGGHIFQKREPVGDLAVHSNAIANCLVYALFIFCIERKVEIDAVPPSYT